jgi:hypothetical protein
MPQFADPTQGSVLKLDDILGHAILVKPLSHELAIPTAFGESDAVKVNVVDLTTGTFHENVLWFPGYVVGSLKTQIGKLVLAQVAQGTPKPGQSPPWVLNPMSGNPEVVAAAEAWLAANPGVLDTFAAPAATPAPTVAAPVVAAPVLGAPTAF